MWDECAECDRLIHSLPEMALSYAAHGWPVLPLYAVTDGACNCYRAAKGEDCGRDAAKHPRLKRGLLDASTDPEVIARWWTMWPQSNIGIATGKVSGLTVIDIDPYNGGMETVEAMGLFLPRTAQVLTQRGGFHLYYGYRGKVKGSMGKGIDVKSDGGYVVAPPSVGVHGAYAWQVAMEPQPL